MKKFIFVSAITLLIISCKNEASISESEIRITTTNDSISHIELYRPVNGISMWSDRVDSIQKTGNGDFALKFDIEKPEYARLKIGNTFFKMILLPNQNYQVDFNGADMSFQYDNAKGQELLNKLKKESSNSFRFINQFNKDSTAIMISDRINNLKSKEISEIEILYSNEELDNDFYELIKQDVDYYYAAGLSGIIEYKTRTLGEALKKDLQILSAELANQYPYQIDVLPFSWNEYVMNLLVHSTIYSEKTSEELQRLYEEDRIHQLYLDVIDAKVDSEYTEKLKADYILSSVKQIQYEKSLVTVFDDFKSTYPNSEYTKYLEDDILAFRDYHKKISEDLSEKVVIVKDESIDNFKTLLDNFKGEKLYVDMWATWCGPCKKEFEHNNEVTKVLEANNYKKLYISLDRVKDKDRWLEMIKFYNLEGYHHLANEALFKEFEKNYSNIENAVSIPQYLLIKEDGEIITTDAPRPSAYKELEKMISE